MAGAAEKWFHISFLFSPLLHSFPSENCVKSERGSFRWSNVLLFFHHWRVVMVCCVHFQMPFFPLNLNTESADRILPAAVWDFSKHWKIANNLTLRRSCWGKNRKSTSNSTRKYTSKAFLWPVANPQASRLEYIQAYRNWKKNSERKGQRGSNWNNVSSLKSDLHDFP